MSDDETQQGFTGRQRFSTETGRDWGFADRLGDMISAQAPDGTYRYASAAAKDVLGYEPDELIGTSAYDYFHPDDVPKVGVARRGALGGTAFRVVYRLRRKNNEYVWAETTNRIVSNPETNEVVEILGCTRLVEHRETAEEMDDEERDACTRRIESVLANEAIEPVFQPIVELDSERTIAYEALSRFPDDQSYAPGRWFDDAWRVGLGIPLELLAARIAAAAALPRLPDKVCLSINASPPTVAARGFVQSFGNRGNRIAVEVTEHLRVNDYEDVRLNLSPLRAAGGQVAIDDFGAGYASLQHILKISPEWIKLDISLTERIGRDPIAQAMATALAAFAEKIGISVVAEGIEAADDLAMLRGLGICYGQGFYLGRPEPLESTLSR
ncbi:MAG: EAL domain-containing protein [Solirubrobacterales bacterium]